jgi:cytosine/uracil/thiamine/allantoin permease
VNTLLTPRPLTLQTSGYWFAAFLVLAVVPFWPTYFGRLPARIDLLTHAHAALMAIWLGMLIAQPFLIRRDRRPLHRLIGRAS